jgi:hypothetical protein
VSNRGLVVPVDGRRMISTVVGVMLVAAGAIVRFAVPATFAPGLNTHDVSVIVMLAGILGLLLSLLVWGPLGRRRNHGGGSGRGEPAPGSAIPARTGRHRRARRSRDRESALRETGTGRRIVSHDSTSPRDPPALAGAMRSAQWLTGTSRAERRNAGDGEQADAAVTLKPEN